MAYYRLNDHSAHLTDSTINRIDGALGSNVALGGDTLTSPSDSASAVFSGSPAGSDIPSNTATVAANAVFAQATQALSIEAWIRPRTFNATNHFVPIVSYGREAQGQAWVLQISPQSTLNFWMKARAGAAPFYVARGNTVLSPTQTYQVVATYNGSSIRLYVNGVFQTITPASGSIDYAGLSAEMGLAIGGALGSIEPTFNGNISDVSIYHGILSNDDIAQHYAVGKGATSGSQPTPIPVNTPGPLAYPTLVAAGNPIAYYTLKDAASTMSDSSGHQLDGVYGAHVRHAGAVLTSAQDQSSVFPGTAMGTDGFADTGTVPANPVFRLANTSLTVEAWVKLADYNRTNAFVPIVSYGRQAIGNVWALQLTPQSTLAFYFKVNGNVGSYLVRSVQLVPARVYQIAATYDGANAKVFINGALVQTLPANGTLNYSGFAPIYGLTVGGATGGAAPVFNGAINDVSIYPTALSADLIENHYLTGNLVAQSIETPANSDALVDSIGVVTHLRVTGGPYTKSFAHFEQLLRSSGIRHIGDALTTDPPWYPVEINKLAADGIHSSLVTDSTQTAQTIANTITSFANAIEAVEGPNEPDKSDDPNWVANTRAFQKMLWMTVKNNPATAQIAVLGPSLTSVASDNSLGDLSPYLDYSSLHDYFDGYNPGTAGWGSLSRYGIYGSLAYNRNISAIVSGAKPSIATESGYGNLRTDTGGIDDRTLARYIPRLYLEHYLAGIKRTTLYEFYDEPGNGNFDDFGLVQLDDTPKTSYYAVQSLISLLADPGAPFATAPLHYLLTGNVDNLHHLLLQKRDGTYELALWIETPSYDGLAKRDLPVAEHLIALTPANTPVTGRLSTIDDTGHITTASLGFVNGIAAIAIDDRVTIVSFK